MEIIEATPKNKKARGEPRLMKEKKKTVAQRAKAKTSVCWVVVRGVITGLPFSLLFIMKAGIVNT
ncbi:MAG: hypothetical protein HEQ39_08180 [Rhizobacter sp.]